VHREALRTSCSWDAHYESWVGVILRFHESHSRPEATALWTENEASKFCHPLFYAGKSRTERRAATLMREDATTPMQYEDRCVIAGTHF
jgi:hypothetical protein